MRDGETVRNVAIVADGSTDHQVLAKLIDVFVHSQRTDIINFRFHHLEELNLRDDVDRFRRDASKNDQYGLHQKPARRLQQAVLDILLTAAGQFQDSAGEHLTDSDLLLLNTDAESHLRESGRYFDDPWAVALRRSFDHAIERFYHLKAAREHLPMEYAPMILPLIFFPSTDILVATVRPDLSGDFRGTKASEIKIALYGVHDLRMLGEEEFERMALKHFSRNACPHIYQKLPEARPFLRTLKWNTTSAAPD